MSSDVIQALREVEDVPIYSNVPSTVYLWTRADSYGLRSFSTKLEDRSLEESVLILFEYDPVSARIQRITEDLVYLGGDDIASMYLYKP